MIGGSEFTARPVLASYDAGTINAATYAVTVEQAGGSPDGKPHLTPVFAGKLIETVPAGAELRLVRTRFPSNEPLATNVVRGSEARRIGRERPNKENARGERAFS